MDKILSIVIPSYNVEKYLEETLSSLIIDDEHMNMFEALIVDDGSKDTTPDIASKYQEKYPNTFRLISKENGGHGSTINVGIKESIGRYFKVLDGDDWFDTVNFKQLLDKLVSCDSDAVITNYYEVDDNTRKESPVCFGTLLSDEVTPIEEVLAKVQIPMHALVIKSAILKDNNIRMDENRFYVDVEYVLFPIPYIKDIVYFDTFIYKYRLAVVTQSVSMQGFQKHIQDHIDVALHLAEFVEDYKEDNEVKKAYLIKRTAQMARDQVDIFMSFSIKEQGIKEKFMTFDSELKKRSMEVYVLSGYYSGMLRSLRKRNFKGYHAIMLLSKLRNKA
ncbi:MAG: glycosyltransferase family 2 protein [Suipraeoptans sp.]